MMNSTFRFYFSILIIGLIAGLVGVFLTYLLHHIQHLAFGYGMNGVEMSFREGVEQSSYQQRMIALTLAGLVGGLGWYALHRYAKLVSIKQALDQPQQGVPFFSTLSHSLLQIITVGLGSPLGREVAPREMSVAFASIWLKKIRLTDEDAKLLLACASGAGLTVVYNVPLAATIFILETMWLAFSKRALAAALLCVSTATLLARYFLGDLVQYAALPKAEINQSALIFSLILGAFIGILANLFQSSTKPFPVFKRTDKRLIGFSILAFAVIGLISLYQPDILGNGKAGNQLVFHVMLNGQESFQLFTLKWLTVLLALAAGAYGGLITPSMMLGSTIAYSLAFVWNCYFPAVSLETIAIVGACAFLGVSLKMPITAVIFLLELTRGSADLLMPLVLATTMATLSNKCYQYWQTTK